MIEERRSAGEGEEERVKGSVDVGEGLAPLPGGRRIEAASHPGGGKPLPYVRRENQERE